MSEAWDMTPWEFALLNDFRNKLRTVEKEAHVYDAPRLDGLAEHLRNIGIEV